MEGRIEGSNRRMMDLVDACRVSSPDFPQIPTYVKRNEANPSSTLLLPTEVRRFEYSGRCYITPWCVCRFGGEKERRGRRDETTRDEPDSIRFVNDRPMPSIKLWPKLLPMVTRDAVLEVYEVSKTISREKRRSKERKEKEKMKERGGERS